MFIGNFTGYLAGDAELREYEGKKFYSFSVGVKDVHAKEGSETVWVQCTTNNTKIGPFLKKGKAVAIVGDCIFPKYEGKMKIECHTYQIELLDRKGDGQGQ